MKSKSGAIELSMTTIIVVVLGITLLILGLAFIRGIFGNLGDISDETFDNAQDLLVGLESFDDFLTLRPERIELKQGEDKPVKLTILNQGREEITISVLANSRDENLECLIFDAGNTEEIKKEERKSQSSSYTLTSGEHKSMFMVIKDKNGDLRTTGCNVAVQGAPAGISDTSKVVIVKVIKSESLF